MRQRSPFGKRFALVAMASLVMSACGGGGGGGGVVLPPVTGIIGNVSNSRGGPGVSGATITATQSMVSATTNPQGAYSLALNPGPYDVVAAAPGMAASKFQHVVVVQNSATTANLIMFPVFDPTKPVAAPTISVTGLTQSVAGSVPFTITVTASNPVRRIDVRTGNLNALPQTEFVDTGTANTTLISTALANGPGFVDIIAYDLNQNAAELIVAFTVNNPASGSAPATPTGFFVEAVTTGQSLGLFSTRRAQLFSTLGIRQDPHIITVGSRSINILAAPSNATLFVEPAWNAVTGATGYKVYRSSSGAGPFVLVAQVTTTFYDDADPSLAPGVPVTYRVTAFNVAGESAPTAATTVTPLPAFNLNLTSPRNGAAGASTQPIFSWTPTSLVGVDQFYDIFVTGLNDVFPAWQTTNFTIRDITSLSFGAFANPSVPPLQSGKMYQWDIYEALALTQYAINSVAIAVANGSGQVATGSLNGPFTFTTAL